MKTDYQIPDFSLYMSDLRSSIRCKDIQFIKKYYIYQISSYYEDHIDKWYEWVNDMHEFDRRRIGLELRAITSIHNIVTTNRTSTHPNSIAYTLVTRFENVYSYEYSTIFGSNRVTVRKK